MIVIECSEVEETATTGENDGGSGWHVEVQEVEVSQIRFLPRNRILNSCKSTLFVRHSLELLILITQLLHDLTTALTCSSSSLSLAAYNTTRSSTASSSTLFCQ